MNEMRINRFSEEGVMKRGLTVVLAALVLLTGCDGGYGDGGYGDGEDRFVYNLVSMEIADAQSLYLGLPEEKDGVTARDMDGYVLFKVTKDGIIAKVKFHYEKEAVGDSEDGNTEDGNTENEDIDILQPQTVWNANEEYFIVTFSKRDTYTDDIPYLVSKKTGAVYSLGNVGAPYERGYGFENHPVVLSDGQNNLYYATGDDRNGGDELYCVNVSNPEKVFAKALTSVNDEYLYRYMVDVAGNVIYSCSGSNRLVFAGGGYKNLDTAWYWTAPDGKLYYGSDYVYDETTGKSGYPIYRLDIEGQKVTETEYGNVDFRIYTGVGTYYLTSGDRAYILDSNGRLAEVYNPDGKPHLVEGVPALTNIQAVTQSEEELFIAGESDGEPRVIRVNPMTGAWSDLYTPGDYEVYNMVYADGRLTVNALRMNDGAIIMGEFDGTGKMKVLDEKSNSKVLYLTRIR